MDQSQTSICEYSEDYPLGGSLEPYDIWRDNELMEKVVIVTHSWKIRHLPRRLRDRCLRCYEYLNLSRKATF